MSNLDHVAYFEDLEKQAHAARLGMWVFLASELLLFAALFALYASGRAAYPDAFSEAVHHNTKILGSVNTGVLLLSSYAVASSLNALREGRQRRTVVLLGITIALGLVFLIIKVTEYAEHFREGIFPGQVQFWTLYYMMTGLHALHVIVGMIILTVMLVKVSRGSEHAGRTHVLANAAVYWHLIDVIWIFLWPLFYLA
ncbi:MAG: cytochrome c oxidase subunit 3 [Polyangiaceae bacterium]